jgi:hypothetical protein
MLPSKVVVTDAVLNVVSCVCGNTGYEMRIMKPSDAKNQGQHGINENNSGIAHLNSYGHHGAETQNCGAVV